MNSSFFISLDIDQKTLSNNSDILGELLTAFIESIGKREKGPKTSLHIEILCLPSEKKKQIPWTN